MYTEFGKNLRRLREGLGKTQQQIAEQIGVSRKSYSAYETGRRVPGRKALISLSEYYKVPLEQLFSWDMETINAVSEIQQDAGDYEMRQEAPLGVVFRRLRQEKHISLLELSEEFQIPLNVLAEFENGVREIPQHIITEFAKYFGVDMKDIIVMEFAIEQKHAIFTNNEKLKRRYQKWESVIGYDNDFTDDEIDEIISFARYIKWRKKQN